MESVAWGWILLGIAIGYLLNDRRCAKNYTNSDHKSFERPPFGPLTIPVTRLRDSIGDEIPVNPNSNISRVKINSTYDIKSYFINGENVPITSISSYIISEDYEITLDVDDNTISIGANATLNTTHTVYITFNSITFGQCIAQFGIEVVL